MENLDSIRATANNLLTWRQREMMLGRKEDVKQVEEEGRDHPGAWWEQSCWSTDAQSKR
jgi:hypothetical protein